jgi:hypothetical protein
MTTWDQAMPVFKDRWQQRFGAHGARWESYEPRYRYGWELARQEENRGKSWFDVQADARRGWEAEHEDVLWATAADPVRDAYEHTADSLNTDASATMPSSDTVMTGSERGATVEAP